MDLKIRPFRDGDIDRVLEISILAWTPVFESFRRILGDSLSAIIYPDWKAEQRQTITCNATYWRFQFILCVAMMVGLLAWMRLQTGHWLHYLPAGNWLDYF